MKAQTCPLREALLGFRYPAEHAPGKIVHHSVRHPQHIALAEQVALPKSVLHKHLATFN